MKIIPKFAKGGTYDAFFEAYTPIASSKSKPTASSGRSSKSSSDDDDSKLIKLFLDMVKELDGLPNEMRNIATNLLSVYQSIENPITGTIDTKLLANAYIKSLLDIKTAKYNADIFKTAKTNAESRHSMNEVAISPLTGKIWVLDVEDGTPKEITLDTYIKHQNDYAPITNSQLLWMRSHLPQFIGHNEILLVIENSMSSETFYDLINKAIKGLGYSTDIYSGLFTINNQGKVSAGLEILNKLDKSDLAKISGNVTLEGLYRYVITDKSQQEQVSAALTYIVSTLPQNAKVWAGLKTGNTNINDATKNLVLSLLLSTISSSHNVSVDYKGTESHVRGDKKESGNNQEPKRGFWTQVQNDLGGNELHFNLLHKKTSLNVNGKFHSMVPGIQGDCSLSKFILDSRMGFVIDTKNITFGDQELSQDSFNDIMVNASGGMAIVTLPAKNGLPWFEVLDAYTNAEHELKNLGLLPDTPAYNLKRAELYNKYEIFFLLNGNQRNPKYFKHFAVLEGIAAGKAKTQDGTKIKASDFVIDYKDDEQLVTNLKKGLSSKENGQYDFDDRNIWREWTDDSYEHVYKGNIYILLNNNPINGMNADNNDLKESQAYGYEHLELQWIKDANKNTNISAEYLNQ